MKLKKRKKLYSKGKLHTTIMISLINKRWYCYAKTMAEKNAVEIAKRDALDLISICLTHVMGPLSKSPTNANVAYRIFGGQMKGKYWPIVDVRDVANALLLAYENPIAKGRYISTSHTITEKDPREKMRILNPNLNLPPQCASKMMISMRR
ncbi:cinnamoyl-CoA reductase 1-like [Vicia villosa]|uniref:cinnamoyl-CoA reductase 1-like n=1 Tax=Vicia villosa TaxID=3911 RepID=UPI00273C96AD|nr:cinnamoyl-CoA reductase 1-like [Vicia villosa]